MWLLSCATSSELQFYKEISPFSPDLFVAPTEERTLIADRRIVILNENNQQIHSYTKLQVMLTPKKSDRQGSSQSLAGHGKSKSHIRNRTN